MAIPTSFLDVSLNNWPELTLRLFMALLLGGIVGLNRELSGKSAGLRTHMLVSLGAALFVMVPLAGDASREAVSRAVQGVATGVGFLGAGEIVHQSRQSGRTVTKGLTSAASIWVTAALGMLAAAGLWVIGLIGLLLTILILEGVKYLERWLPGPGDDQ